MGLCSPRACGCAIGSASLTVVGSGVAGDPFLIEGAAPVLETNAQRLARAGGDLWDGLLVKTSDTNELWLRTASAWTRVRTRMRGYGVDLSYDTGSPMTVWDSSTTVTSAAGIGTIPYGVTFLSAPGVGLVGGDGNVPVQLDFVNPAGLTSFTFQARTPGGGLHVGNTRVNWVATGLVA